MPSSQTCRKGRYVQEGSLQYGYQHSGNDSYIPGSLYSNWNVGAIMFNITVQPHIRLLTLAFEFILQNLGIQCVRRKDAPASLAQREKIQVDPFKQGFMHANMAINLNAIRLCFQVKIRIYRYRNQHSELNKIDLSHLVITISLHFRCF